MKILPKITWVIGLLLIVVLAGPGHTAIVNVPADQPTIQAGIDAAGHGDTVLIAPGLYSGEGNRDIDPLAKGLLIIGDGDVVINAVGDSTDKHAAFAIFNDEDSSTVIENFTITGAADPDGAVKVFWAEVRIRGCRITGNQTHGLNSIGYAHPIVDSCLIYGNTGDGILVAGLLVPLSDLSANWCTVADNGGFGIRLRASWRVDITNCTIAKNQDGGFYLEGDPPKTATNPTDEPTTILTNCLIWNNEQLGIGQGMYYPDPDIVCCNIFGNGDDPTDNYALFPWYAGDTSGSMSYDPLVTNEFPWPRFEVRDDSPCLPANNSCSVQIGAWGAGSFVCECGSGFTGDVNLDGNRSLTDLTLLANHLFVTFVPLPCPPMGNATGDAACALNLTDLTAMVNHLFVTFDPISDVSSFDNCLCY